MFCTHACVISSLKASTSLCFHQGPVLPLALRIVSESAALWRVPVTGHSCLKERRKKLRVTWWAEPRNPTARAVWEDLLGLMVLLSRVTLSVITNIIFYLTTIAYPTSPELSGLKPSLLLKLIRWLVSSWFRFGFSVLALVMHLWSASVLGLVAFSMIMVTARWTGGLSQHVLSPSTGLHDILGSQSNKWASSSV